MSMLRQLGSQAGLAGVRGEANANIECFCDEESIIMGLLIVTLFIPNCYRNISLIVVSWNIISPNLT